jgi:hypothetical protein
MAQQKLANHRKRRLAHFLKVAMACPRQQAQLGTRYALRQQLRICR